MNNFLLTIAALLLLAIGALFAVPPMIDWNQYRGVFEEEVSRFLGREVRVGGDVHLRILPMPYVGFEQVRIADAPGISGPFVRADRFTLWLSVPPLLRGVIEARKIEIRNPELRLRFDDTGGGNWQTLTPRGFSLPFVPTQIALQSVNIRNGKITLENARGVRLASVERINGDLSAEALEGPYKFVGTVGAGHGGSHDVRISTTPADAKGAIRVALISHASNSPASLALDGVLGSSGEGPEFSGKLKLRASVGPAPRQGGTEAAKRTIDLSAAVKSTYREADISALSVSFDSGGRPQLLEGSAKATWADGIVLRGRLASRWLDLDALIGSTPDAGPLPALYRFVSHNPGAALPGRTVFDISVDQANLGGDAISRVRARVGLSDDRLDVERLNVELPGGAKLAVDGAVLGNKKGPVFAGHIIMTGESFQRFSRWAKIPFKDLAGAAQGKFALRGDVRLDAEQAALTNAIAQLSRARLEGAVTYNWSTPQLSIAAEVNELDLSGFGKNLLAPGALRQLAGFPQGSGGASPVWPQLWSRIPLKLELHGARVNDGSRKLETFDVHIVRKDDRLQVRRARFALASGVHADLKGSIKLGGTPVSGRLEGILGADTERGAQAVFGLIGDVSKADALTRHLRAAAPMRMAFSALFGDEGDRTTIEADGQIRQDRVWLRLRTDGPIDQWRSRRVHLAINLTGQNARATTAWLRPDIASRVADDGAKGTPVGLRLNVRGIPSRGLRAIASIDSAMLGVAASANLLLSDADELTWKGQVNVNSADLLQAARVFAPDLAALAGSLPATGALEVNRTSKHLELRPNALRIGQTRLSGRILIGQARATAAAPQLEAELALDQADAGDLLGALLSKRVATASPDGTSTEADPPFWTDRPFDLAALSGLAGRINMTVGRLSLADGLGLNKVELAAVLGAEGVSISRLTGRAYGGVVTGTATFKQAAAGVALSISASTRKLPLADFAPAGLKDRFAGTTDITISAKGQALSPSAMITNLRGNGTLELNGVALPGINPTKLSEFANRVVAAEVDPKEIDEQLKKLVLEGVVRPANAKIPLEIGDGALQLGEFAWTEADARATNKTTLDLLRLAVDSEWRIWPHLNATADMPTPKPLPPVQVVNVGPLAKLPETEPQISAGSLQRELTVRRMEVDVARLERLRREDEERARAEKERLERLEEERQKAIEEERRRRQQETERGPPLTPIPGAVAPSPSGRVERKPLPPPGTTGSVLPRSQPAPPAVAAPAPQPRPNQAPVTPQPVPASQDAVKPDSNDTAQDPPGRVADQPRTSRAPERRRSRTNQGFDRNRILFPQYNDAH